MKINKLMFIPLSLLLLSGCNNTNNDENPTPEPTPTPTPSENVYTSVSEIRAATSGGKGKINAKIISKEKSSFIAYDGTGLILCYGYTQTSSVNVNSNYTIEGDVVYYANMLQFSHSSEKNDETGEYEVISTFTVSEYPGEVASFTDEATTITSISSFDNTKIEYVHIDQLISYKNGSYINSKKLANDSLAISLKGDSSYLSVLDDTSEDRPKTISCTGFITGTSSSFANMFVSEKASEVSVNVTSLSVSDSLANTYTRNTIYDNSNGLEVIATHENDMKVKLNSDEYSYSVTNSNGETVDTSKAFTSGGTYTVKVTYKDSDISSTFTFNVDDSSDTIVSLTPNELGELNTSWKSGNTSNKEGVMDDVITLNAGGSGTGKWSKNEDTWTITQKVSTEFPNGGYLKVSAKEGYYLKTITISYSPKSGDTVGHFEHLVSDEPLDMEENCSSYLDYVKGSTDEVTNSCVRIRRITVKYAIAS